MGKKKDEFSFEENVIYGVTAVLVIGVLFWTGLKQGAWWAITIVIVLSILILVGLVYFVFIIKHKVPKKGIKLAKMSEIDKMDGIEFENFLAVLFTQMGYKVQMTPNTDQGADLIIKKNQRTIVVQAKRYSTPVGNHAVQEAVTAVRYYKADEAWVVTNFERYTLQAVALAKKNDVRLIARSQLAKWINQYNK